MKLAALLSRSPTLRAFSGRNSTKDPSPGSPARKGRFRVWRIAGLTLVALALLLALLTGVRRLLRPGVPGPTSAQIARAGQVRIVRDEWGVPHIDGKTDADAAFGLAFAHAEDDYALIEGALVAARGDLARKLLSKQAIVNDFYVRLFRVQEETAQQYDSLSPDVRAVLEAYAEGFNYYAALHPEEADGRFFPVRGQDVAAGFVHKLPLFQGIHIPLQAIMERADLKVGTRIQTGLENPAGPGPGEPPIGHSTRSHDGHSDQLFAPETLRDSGMIASNGHAVGRRRAADGIVRLNVNSHQPWEGPVAWYEAHVTSGEGWNMIGGTFPGAPLIFHGHNAHLGWAHIVNAPDMWDVFQLEMHPADENRYRFGERWLELDARDSAIVIELGPFAWHEKRTFYTSVYGPTIKTDAGVFAVRNTGHENMIRTVEQWFRMNKARDFGEWQAAMRLQAIPMFHTVYADARNIHYVYNALIPLRDESYDWNTVVPGNDPATLWTEYLPQGRLPAVTNPPADYVQNCNSDPFFTTAGAGNPVRSDFSPTAGIETRMTNRARRSHELYGGDQSITREEFLRYKWDRTYTRSAPIYAEGVDPVLRAFAATGENSLPTNRFEREALALLRNWDGRTDETSRAAAVAILLYRPIFQAVVLDRSFDVPAPVRTFREAVAYLVEHYGRVAVPLGDLQRLRRGDVDLPIGGGPDVMSAVHSKMDGEHLVGWAGDSYILFVEFYPDGPRSLSLHQYGNVNRPRSAHYADQTRLFTRRTLRRSLFDPAELAERTARSYRPGQKNR